jgi:peptidoglycan/xylan/chitin deacetylase (PgdA/CDA1 family)
MYHEIAEDNDDIEAWTVVKKSDFIRQMEYLTKYFNIISLQDALKQINNPLNNGYDKPSVVVTFDDGYAGNYRVLLPIVKSMNIPVTVFVATKHIQDQSLYWYDRLINALQGCNPIELNLSHLSLGNYRIHYCRGPENWREIERLLSDLKTLNPDSRENAVEGILKSLNSKQKVNTYTNSILSIHELRELSKCPLITIGAHSHCHNILTQLSDDEIKKSIKTSKQLLETWIGRPVQYFAYPNGNYNDDVVNIFKKADFECSLTTVAKPWDDSESFFTIPRIGIGRYDSLDYFRVKVSGMI